MDPRRGERVAEALREELDELIGYELDDPRVTGVQVVEVRLSPDGRHANVRLLMTAGGEDGAIEALQHARSYLKRQLSARLDLFRLPELHFEAAVDGSLAGRAKGLLTRVRRDRRRVERASGEGKEGADGA